GDTRLFQVLRFLCQLPSCVASHSSVIRGVADCSSCWRQFLHLRQPFLHIRCLLGKNEGCKKSDRLRLVHCVFSSPYRGSNHSRPAIYYANLVMAGPCGNCGSKWSHSCSVGSAKEDGVRRPLRRGVRLVLQRPDGASRLAACVVGLSRILHAGIFRFFWLHGYRPWLRQAARV